MRYLVERANGSFEDVGLAEEGWLRFGPSGNLEFYRDKRGDVLDIAYAAGQWKTVTEAAE